MPSISYEKVDLSEKRLIDLHGEIERAEGMKRYAKFKAWLHFANLKRWRDQRHHFFYLTRGYPDKASTWHCTCGLVVGSDDLAAQDVPVPSDISLDPVQRVRGHLNLPSGRGITVALIVNFSYSERLKKLLWNVFCQECSSFELGKLLYEAQDFVKEHNKRCKPSLARKKKLLRESSSS